MSFLPTLLPWQWALLAAVPIGITLLYFLKLRRQSVPVSSTLLWSKTVEELHVNSLLQRLRRNLLLFLQLLAVALAALALLRPGVRQEAMTTQRHVFLLDCSASMQATDVAPDANRFAQAKRLIAAAIDGMSDAEVAMLITFSDRAEVLQSFTSDRSRLRQALAQAEVTARPTEILEALRAAQGLAAQGLAGQGLAGQGAASNGNLAAEPPAAAAPNAPASEVPTDGAPADGAPADGAPADGAANVPAEAAAAAPADLLIYSDGGFAEVRDFDWGHLRPTYIRVGSESPSNLAILSFSAERSAQTPEEVEVFATVANLGAVAAGATATLTLEGALVDAQEVQLPPGEETGLAFTVAAGDAARLELELEVDDDFALDNVAYSGIAPPRLVQVLVVTPGNPPLELALSTGLASSMCRVETVAPQYLREPAYHQRVAQGRDDLIIFDRCAPETMPPSNTFFIGALPPQGWKAGETSNQVLLVDIDRQHPIMRYLELFSLLIAEGTTLELPPGATELLSAEQGPILALAPREGYQDLVLGFEILSQETSGEETSSQEAASGEAVGGTVANTDWHVQRSWPVFILNVLRHLAGAAEGSSLASYRPGETAVIRAPQHAGELEIQTPSGARQSPSGGSATATMFSGTEQLGLYDVHNREGRLIDRFAVNLMDVQESGLAAAGAVRLGEEPLSTTAVATTARREYWRVLLLGVLGVITLEWWLYSRRLA